MKRIVPKIQTLFKTGFFHIFGGSVLNKIFAFLSSVILVWILTKTEYGIFTYAWNIYSIVILFSGMGIESGVLQLSSEHSSDTKYLSKVSNFGTRFGIKFNLILVAVLLGIGLFAPLKIDGADRLLCAVCVMPFAQLLFNMTSISLRSQKRNKEFAQLQVTNTILILVISAVCAFFLRELGLVIGYYVAYIAAYLVGLFVFKVRLFEKNIPSFGSEEKTLLKIAAISMINSGLSQLMYLLDVFVLGIVDPQETLLASYKVATMIPSALAFIPVAMITYLYPYFAEHKEDGDWCLRRYKQVLIGLGGLNIVISTILFICAPLIIRLLFGEQYLDAVPVFRILSVNYFFSGTFRTISGNLLVTQRKLKFNLFVAVISSLTNIVADYFFIQWWGSIGAAWATVLVVLISSVLSTAYLIYTFRKNRKTASC